MEDPDDPPTTPSISPGEQQKIDQCLELYEQLSPAYQLMVKEMLRAQIAKNAETSVLVETSIESQQPSADFDTLADASPAQCDNTDADMLDSSEQPDSEPDLSLQPSSSLAPSLGDTAATQHPSQPLGEVDVDRGLTLGCSSQKALLVSQQDVGLQPSSVLALPLGSVDLPQQPDPPLCNIHVPQHQYPPLDDTAAPQSQGPPLGNVDAPPDPDPPLGKVEAPPDNGRSLPHIDVLQHQGLPLDDFAVPQDQGLPSADDVVPPDKGLALDDNAPQQANSISEPDLSLHTSTSPTAHGTSVGLILENTPQDSVGHGSSVSESCQNGDIDRIKACSPPFLVVALDRFQQSVPRAYLNLGTDHSKACSPEGFVPVIKPGFASSGSVDESNAARSRKPKCKHSPSVVRFGPMSNVLVLTSQPCGISSGFMYATNQARSRKPKTKHSPSVVKLEPVSKVRKKPACVSLHHLHLLQTWTTQSYFGSTKVP